MRQLPERKRLKKTRKSENRAKKSVPVRGILPFVFESRWGFIRRHPQPTTKESYLRRPIPLITLRNSSRTQSVAKSETEKRDNRRGSYLRSRSQLPKRNGYHPPPGPCLAPAAMFCGASGSDSGDREAAASARKHFARAGKMKLGLKNRACERVPCGRWFRAGSASLLVIRFVGKKKFFGR